MIRLLHPSTGLLAVAICLSQTAGFAQQGTAHRTGLGTPLAPADDGTARYREDSGWDNSNFAHVRWGVTYDVSRSDSSWAAVLQSARTNAAFTASANQLTLDLNGNTYTILPYLDGSVRGGKTLVIDPAAAGGYLRIINGTFNNSVGGSAASTVIGDQGATGRLFIENALLQAGTMTLGATAGSTGLLRLDTAGRLTVSNRLLVGVPGTGSVELLGDGSTVTAGDIEIGGYFGTGSVTLDHAGAVLQTNSSFGGNASGDLSIDNPVPAQFGENVGLRVRAGAARIEGSLWLASKGDGKLGAVSIEGGTVTVGNEVIFDHASTETVGGKVFLRDGRLEVAAPSAFRPAAQRQFYWEVGTLAFSGADVGLTAAQLGDYTRQGAISYGGDRAAGALATGQVLEAAEKLTLTGGTFGLAGGTIRAGTELVVNAPIAGHGTLDAVVSGTGAIDNATTNVLAIGALDGANAISSAGELRVGGRNVDATFAGTSTGSGTFAKVGTGTQSVSGSVSNSAVEVRQGTLAFDGVGPRLTTSSLAVADAGRALFVNGSTGIAGSATIGVDPAAGTPGQLEVRGTGSVLTVSGDLTNNGWIEIAGGTLDVGGSLVNHGRLINNGTLDAVVGGSGTITGGGTFAGPVTVAAGAMLAPGNSPGTATFSDLILAPGGTFELELAAATGTAGVAWDLAAVTDLLSITATAANPYVIVMKSLDGSFAPGTLAGFDPSQDHSWRFIAAALANPQSVDLSAFRLDTTDFSSHNDLGVGGLALSAAADGLYVVFSPQPASVPEPSSTALLALAGLAAAGRRWRRRSRLIRRDPPQRHPRQHAPRSRPFA